MIVGALFGLLGATLTAQPARAAPSTWMQSQTAGLVPITGRFVQPDYGYSIKAPPHGTAFTGGHDVLIILGEHREVAVFPYYLVMEPAPKPCDASQLPSSTGKVGLVKPIKLDNVAACEVSERHGNAIYDLIQAEKDADGTETMYSLQLTTTPQAARRDERSFQAITTSFQLVRISP